MRDLVYNNLPESFKKKVVALCGEEGTDWLARLGDLAERYSDKWSLTDHTFFADLTYNFAVACRDPMGRRLVLKLGLPLKEPELEREAECLSVFDGRGTVRVVNADLESRAILIDRCYPGKNLFDCHPEDPKQAVESAIELAKSFPVIKTRNPVLQTIEDWFGDLEEIDRGSCFPLAHSQRALEYIDELTAVEKFRILHGDFHHTNILSISNGRFLAIDPKGVFGPRGYDAGVFLNNHLEWVRRESLADDLIEDAVGRFSEAFGISRGDLKKWAYAQKVLSAYWDNTGNGPYWKKDLATADYWRNGS